MPGALHDFLFRMPANLTQFQESNHYMWERHVTFKGFWRLLLQGRDTGPTSATVMVFWFACWGAIAAMLRGAIWNVRIQNSKLKLQNPTQHSGLSTQHSTDRLIAATIATTPLLMPFYFDYDMLLLSVAAVLYVADRMRSPAMATDRLAAMAWTTLFISFQFGTVIAGQTHFNVNVLAAPHGSRRFSSAGRGRMNNRSRFFCPITTASRPCVSPRRLRIADHETSGPQCGPYIHSIQ